MSEKLSEKVFNGIKWKTFERFALQLINGLSPIIMARILMPEDFGAVAILSVFISIANTFVNNGLCNAIVQKQDSDNIDCSTVFYTQVLIAFLCYIILFVSAPFIASFYENSQLCMMLRVLSLSFVIGSFGAMQIAIMKKNMQFHKSFISGVSASIVHAISGIALALMGLGVWSIIFSTIAQQFTLVICNILIVRWHPDFTFSFQRLKSLFSYSWKLMVGWFIGTLHQDVYALIIGKRFSQAILGFYNRASSIPSIFSKTITEVVDGVMFPAMSKIQSQKDVLKEATKTLLSVSSFLVFPLFCGLAAIASPLTSLILTDKWLPSVPMMRFICITFAFNSLNNSNMQVFNAMGRSDIFMKFETIKRSISIVSLLFASFFCIYAVLSVLLFMSLLSNAMNAYQNKKLVGISYLEYIKAISPSVICSLVMFVAVLAVGHLPLSNLYLVSVQVLFGLTFYFALAKLLKVKSLDYILSTLKKTLKKR